MNHWIFVGIAAPDRGEALWKYWDGPEAPVVGPAMRAVTESFGVTLDEMRSQNRSRRIVEARHAWCWFMDKYSNLTRKEVGHVLNRDHSSISHAVKSMRDLLEVDRPMQRKVEYAEGLFLAITQATSSSRAENAAA